MYAVNHQMEYAHKKVMYNENEFDEIIKLWSFGTNQMAVSL